MPLPLILMAAGTALQISGQLGANAAQAAAEKKNAQFYEEQAQFARLSAQRAESLSEVDWTTRYGAQVSAYAGGGVDLSGSAGLTVGGTLKMAVDDLFAIKKKGEMDMKLARLRGGQSAERANTLGSTEYNATQAGSTFLNNLASASQNSSYGSAKNIPTNTEDQDILNGTDPTF